MIKLESILPPDVNLSEFKKPFRVIGIDLGTTNSSVAEIVFDPSDVKNLFPKCVEIRQPTVSEGDYYSELIPSVVAIHDSRVFIGEGAKRLIQDVTKEKNKDIFYECKNEIGTKKIYYKATDFFKSPCEISGKILEFIYDSVKIKSNIPVEQTVITVPASFQASQRNDTLTAAGLAGIFDIDSGDLLDEPVSAFIYYIFSEENDIISNLESEKTFLVFDYGGGTCDVSIFKIGKYVTGEPLSVKYLSVSRYHRLGGGDIDRAIIYDVLIPQIIEQNNLNNFEFDYIDKTKYIEPTLFSVAESLKKGICKEIWRYLKFGKFDTTELSDIVKRFPQNLELKLRNNVYKLNNPQINALQFEEIMYDFLDEDFLYHREDEYKILNSIISPVQDAIDRAGLSKDNIDYCLLVGGSSLIPQVVFKINDYLENAEILKFSNDDKIQTAVALGAAYQSLLLKLTGKGFVQNINHDSILINTSSGYFELVPKHTALPFPHNNEYQEIDRLVIPETPTEYPYKLKIEIVASDEKRILFSAVWLITEKVKKGEKLLLQYKMDENQIMKMRLSLSKNKNKFFNITIDNPFTNIVNPNTIRIKIDEIENEIATGVFNNEEKYEKVKELADLYAEIRFFEKAVEYYKMLLRHSKFEDSLSYYRIANLYSKIGDYQKEEKYCREGFTRFGHSAFLFNLASSKNKQKLYREALYIIDDTIEASPDEAPYYVLKSFILYNLERYEESAEVLALSFNYFNPLKSMDDWELSWYIGACKRVNDPERINEANQEYERRIKQYGKKTPENEGDLPEIIK